MSQSESMALSPALALNDSCKAGALIVVLSTGFGNKGVAVIRNIRFLQMEGAYTTGAKFRFGRPYPDHLLVDGDLRLWFDTDPSSSLHEEHQ